MTHNTDKTEQFSLPLPIPQAARTTAQEFASQQPTTEKADQVQLNTLAVWVVNDYLQLMDIPTDLRASDSWNPGVRLFADVADLELPGKGRLECRPVHSQAHICPIPPEVWHDRIGYVVVQFDESLQEATLLGFTPTASVEAFPLQQLRSPEDLLEHLDRLGRSPAIQTTLNQLQANLSQWLQGVIDTGWQTVDSLLNPAELSPAFAFRGVELRGHHAATSETEIIQRAKLLDLGTPSGHPVMLLVEVSPSIDSSSPTDPQLDVLLQVHPSNQLYLPAGLRLTVLDESGTKFLDAESRSVDNYIQLQFSGSPGESFSVQVALGDNQVTEAFVI